MTPENSTYKLIFLDPSDEAPCKIACTQIFKGDLMDFKTVYNFGKLVDVLTFEIELLNLEVLVKLEDEGLKVYPSPKTLKLIQTKGFKKIFIYNMRFLPQITSDSQI